jgi:hypothetical protein
MASHKLLESVDAHGFVAVPTVRVFVGHPLTLVRQKVHDPASSGTKHTMHLLHYLFDGLIIKMHQQMHGDHCVKSTIWIRQISGICTY